MAVRLPRAGERDRLIRILHQVAEGQAASGEPRESWVPYAEVWGEKEIAAGGERFVDQQLVAETDARYVVRELIEGVLPTMRIEDEGRLYDIQRVDELRGRAGLVILARARAEEGAAA